MSSRVGGAVLALIASVALGAAVATPAWFSGNPTVAGHTLEMQEVHVGLLGAELCNTGGDGRCISRDPKEAFQITAFAELGVAGVGTLVFLVLGFVSFGKSEKRKGLARVALIATLATGAGAATLLVLGPTDQGAIPIGYSFFAAAGATLVGLVACVLALQQTAKVKLRVANRPSQNAMPPGPQPVDMAALLGENQLHPAALGPEPRMGLPPSPGGALPGPSGPLAPPVPGSTTGPAQPLFSSAPQLRPLYEAAPIQGGTGGLVPLPPKPLPTRAPTPVVRRR